MVLYTKIDQHVWGTEDFTDENSLGITGTIYSDAALSSVFDYTGYTLKFKFKAQNRIVFEDVNDVEAVSAVAGTWRYKPLEGQFFIEHNGEVIIRLEKDGTEVSAIGINGSADLHVQLV